MLRQNNMYHTTLCNFGLRVDRRKAFSLECTVGLNPFWSYIWLFFKPGYSKKNLFKRCHLNTEDKIRILKIFGSIMPWCMFGYIFTRFLCHIFLATKTIETWICKLECFLYLHKRDILMVKHVPWENSGIGKTIVLDVFSYQYTFSNFSCIFLNPNNFLQFEF